MRLGLTLVKRGIILRCLDFYYLLPVNENLPCIVGHEHEMKADLFTRRILFQAKNSTNSEHWYAL